MNTKLKSLLSYHSIFVAIFMGLMIFAFYDALIALQYNLIYIAISLFLGGLMMLGLTLFYVVRLLGEITLNNTDKTESKA